MPGSKRSWWQVTKTAKYGFVLGILWAVLAAFEWTVVATGEATPERVILAALMTVLAAVYLISAIRLRRRQRTTEPERTPG